MIRLACIYCETEESDGVLSIPDGWTGVFEFQTEAEAFRDVPLGPLVSVKIGGVIREIRQGDDTVSVTEWFTHLGVCPRCAAPLPALR